MAREVDERKKRKALRKLRRAADLAARGEGPPLSDWEKEFLEEVGQRIEEFGSAFADPGKGNLEDPMSALQTQKLREIDKKARGKGSAMKTRKPLGSRKKPGWMPRVRNIDEDVEEEASPPPPRVDKPSLGLVPASHLLGDEPAREKPERRKPQLRLIRNETGES